MELISKDELYHHGIKGQKWGVRRYQYDDGTLTPAGLRRYSNAEDRARKAESEYSKVHNFNESLQNKKRASHARVEEFYSNKAKDRRNKADKAKFLKGFAEDRAQRAEEEYQQVKDIHRRSEERQKARHNRLEHPYAEKAKDRRQKADEILDIGRKVKTYTDKYNKAFDLTTQFEQAWDEAQDAINNKESAESVKQKYEKSLKLNAEMEQAWKDTKEPYTALGSNYVERVFNAMIYGE